MTTENLYTTAGKFKTKKYTITLTEKLKDKIKIISKDKTISDKQWRFLEQMLIHKFITKRQLYTLENILKSYKMQSIEDYKKDYIQEMKNKSLTVDDKTIIQNILSKDYLTEKQIKYLEDIKRKYNKKTLSLDQKCALKALLFCKLDAVQRRFIKDILDKNTAEFTDKQKAYLLKTYTKFKVEIMPRIEKLKAQEYIKNNYGQ